MNFKDAVRIADKEEREEAIKNVIWNNVYDGFPYCELTCYGGGVDGESVEDLNVEEDGDTITVAGCLSFTEHESTSCANITRPHPYCCPFTITIDARTGLNHFEFGDSLIPRGSEVY